MHHKRDLALFSAKVAEVDTNRRVTHERKLKGVQREVAELRGSLGASNLRLQALEEKLESPSRCAFKIQIGLVIEETCSRAFDKFQDFLRILASSFRLVIVRIELLLQGFGILRERMLRLRGQSVWREHSIRFKHPISAYNQTQHSHVD